MYTYYNTTLILGCFEYAYPYASFPKKDFFPNYGTKIKQIQRKTPVKSWVSCFGTVFQLIVVQNTIIMKAILKLTGYDFSPKRINGNEESIKLSYIANSDGSPRWIWNSQNKVPSFLKFYNAGNKSSWLFTKMIQVIFALELQRLFFKQKKWFYTVGEKPLFDCNSDWALFTGATVNNNKAVLYANKTFYKIACTETATTLVENEYKILKGLQKKSKSFTTPLVHIINKHIIQLSDISENGKRTTKISDSHLKVLNELTKINKQIIAVDNWDWFRQLKSNFLKIQDSRIPQNLIRKIEFLLNTISNKQQVTIGFSQGDFTPWNQFQQGDTIAMYDWELAREDRPYAYDYFHFVIQQGVADKKNWSSIYNDLKEQCINSKGNCLFNNDLDTFKTQLKWYFLTNCMYYLKEYANQDNWPNKTEKLLNLWNEGLDVFFEEEKVPRELVIMEIFDSIQNTEYGALKFPNYVPEKLSETSEIDLVIEKKGAKKLLQLLMNHHLVSRVSVQKKSFKYAIQAVLVDGSILALDLIWQIKVLGLEVMDAHEVYKNNPLSPFGIKQARTIDSARYTALSSLLTNTKVPSRYGHYLTLLEKSQNVMDLQINYCIQNNKNDTSRLLQFIKKNPKNQSLFYLKNSIMYVLDALQNYTNKSGYAITFSGINDAEKSTVIEQIAQRIQKQLRKPVIVLRQRPSILPLLGKWNQSIETVQLDKINISSSQEKNKTTVASLFRLCYYYLDYMIGQFVIYFKYIIRGYVVVYDKYYFDFINNSKQSDILLPKKLTAFGYHFLMQPDFNFLLFADASTIIKKEQEPTKNAIEELTSDYRELFENQQKRRSSSIYQSINNVDFDVTMNQVLKTLTIMN